MYPFISLLLLLPFLCQGSSQSLLPTASSPSPTLPDQCSDDSLMVDGNNLAHCKSWRLAAEANNEWKWKASPLRCAGFVTRYLLGLQYFEDSKMVARLAWSYARGVNVSGDGKDVWIFDVDETLISNVQFYINHPHLSSVDEEDVMEQRVSFGWKHPALPWSYWLYNKLHDELKFEIIILSGRKEAHRYKTERTLVEAGYKPNWKRLILRGPEDLHESAEVFKSGKRAELMAEGYRIHGNCGDQWSDLLGSPKAKRSFKVPNPMYHIS